MTGATGESQVPAGIRVSGVASVGGAQPHREMALVESGMALQEVGHLSVYTKVSPLASVAANEGSLDRHRLAENFELMQDQLRTMGKIGDDEKLWTLGVTTRHAVIRNSLGEKRTIDLVRELQQGERDNELISCFEIVRECVEAATGHSLRTPPPVYYPGRRGNVRQGAPHPFRNYEDFKLPTGAEGAVEHHLDVINGTKQLSSKEMDRQGDQALKVTGACMAFTETFSHGIDLAIQQKKKRLTQLNSEIARIDRMHEQQRPNLRARVREVEDDLMRLESMKQELSSISYISLISAERARPPIVEGVVRDEAAYDQAVETAIQCTRMHLKSTTTNADAYAVGSGMLVASLMNRDMAQHIPNPMSDRLAITRCYYTRYVELPNVEEATLRFYDAFNNAPMAAGWKFFITDAYEKLSGDAKAHIDDIQTQALEAMRAARDQYANKKKNVGKGVFTWKTSGVAKNLRIKVVEPAVQEPKAHISARFSTAQVPPPVVPAATGVPAGEGQGGQPPAAASQPAPMHSQGGSGQSPPPPSGGTPPSEQDPSRSQSLGGVSSGDDDEEGYTRFERRPRA